MRDHMCSSSALTAAFIRPSSGESGHDYRRRAPEGPGFSDYNRRTSELQKGWSQLAGKIGRVPPALYSERTRCPVRGLRWSGGAVGEPDRNDEADLSAKEAQASPCARVPSSHALARRPADAQAPPRQGAQAPVCLSVTGTR